MEIGCGSFYPLPPRATSHQSTHYPFCPPDGIGDGASLQAPATRRRTMTISGPQGISVLQLEGFAIESRAWELFRQHECDLRCSGRLGLIWPQEEYCTLQ